MFLTEKLQRLVDDFAVLTDPQEKLSALIDRAKKIAPLPAEDRTEANKVRGCVSVVWVVCETREGRCYFRSDAASPVVRGLVAVLCDFFTGASAKAIASSTLDPLEALDVLRNLTPTRRNGLSAASRTIRQFAERIEQTR